MSIPDNLIIKYFRLTTDVPEEEIAEMEQKMAAGSNPMEFKRRLAREIVGFYDGEEAANKAEAYFDIAVRRRFPDASGAKDEVTMFYIPEFNLPNIRHQAPMKVAIIDILVDTGTCGSRGEARRLIRQGSIEVNDTKLTDELTAVDLSSSVLIRAGRKLIRVKSD